MNKLFLIFVFTLIAGFAFAQTPDKKMVPQNDQPTQAGEKSKSIGVSSAARKNSLNRVPPVAGQKNSENGPDGARPNPGSPNMHKRPKVRVPQARPNSPVIRPNGLPGNRPSMPKHRPPGGG